MASGEPGLLRDENHRDATESLFIYSGTHPSIASPHHLDPLQQSENNLPQASLIAKTTPPHDEPTLSALQWEHVRRLQEDQEVFGRHRKRLGIRQHKRRCKCPPGCYPAYLASLYDELPWQWALTLTAPSRERLGAWLAEWEMLDWDSPLASPFWLMTLAAHSHIAGVADGVPHAHLAVGGVSYQDMRRLVAAWPGLYVPKKIYDKWGWLHYILSQEDPWQHAQDRFSYCHNLLANPLESDTLETLLQRSRLARAQQAARRSGATRGRRWRVRRARRAALARWDKEPQ